MKKRACLFLLLVFGSVSLFAATIGYEFGIGSGYVFYGSEGTRDRNKLLSDSNQVLLNVNTGALYRIAPQVYFCFGVDSMLDMRWSGGEHIHLIDYAALAGFHIYPGFAGLVGTVEYAFGRRTDVITLDNADDEESHSTAWGNGFRFSLAYDFSHNGVGWAPVIGASWRHMPRGDSNDDIIAVFLRFARK